MEDAPTGQLIRRDSPARPERTKADRTDAGETGSLAWASREADADTEPDVGIAADGDTEPDAGTELEGGRPIGGRRYRTERPPHQRQPAYETARAQATPLPSGFRAWGTLGGLLAWCLISCLLAAWLHRAVVAGLGFCAGSALAALSCRPAALLRMVVAVPAVLAVAEILAQLATLPPGGRHGLAVPVAGGTLLMLAAVAPWLFAGTAAALAIALFRGLPQCVRDLRAELRGRAPQTQQTWRASRAQQVPGARQTPQPSRVHRAP